MARDANSRFICLRIVWRVRTKDGILTQAAMEHHINQESLLMKLHSVLLTSTGDISIEMGVCPIAS